MCEGLFFPHLFPLFPSCVSLRHAGEAGVGGSVFHQLAD